MSPETVKFHIGQRVFSSLAVERNGVVSGILFRPAGVIYYVTWDTMVESTHYDFELSTEPLPKFSSDGGSQAK